MSAIANVRTPENGWITPEEQIKQLHLPITKAVSAVSTLIPVMADLVAQYAIHPKLTHWHTALERLKMLPEKITIPPLPQSAVEFLHTKCPLYDEDELTIGETSILVLVLEAFGTINQLGDAVWLYGQSLSNREDKDSFGFGFFPADVRAEYGGTRFGPTRWELMTDDILPRSRSLTYQEQADKVDALSQKTSVQYEVPSLASAVAAIFLHQVATWERLYPGATEESGGTHTSVQETTIFRGEIRHLIVGGFGERGLSVSTDSDLSSHTTGVAALRKL